MSDPMYGQCRCGGTLTVDHLQNHCPLRPQQDAPLSADALAHVCALIAASRHDVTHVAVLGEN